MKLTEQQRERVVDAPGDFLLLACPGSGKTRSAAARVGRLASETATKVAACSYTNVGAERLSSVIARDVGVVLGPQHFTGTIHRFLLEFVVYPFAHLLGAGSGPHVREGKGWPEVRVGDDNTKRMALDSFRRDADGRLVVTDRPIYIKASDEEIIALVGEEVTRRKGAIFCSRGAITADDAMWVALRILREYPIVATAVSRRFDELLLDEAQDTSELQLACLAELRATRKLKSLVLIGDLEQSIYSFHGASAPRVRKLADDNGLRTSHLTQNHRCSQLICNVAARFCARKEADMAVGVHADCTIEPEVVVYPVKEPMAAMEVFRARLAFLGIDPSQAAVLARRWSIASQLNGVTSPVEIEPRPFRLGRLASDLAAGRLTRSDVIWAQQTIAYVAWDVSHLDALDDEQRAALRRVTYRFLRAVPPLKGDLQTWIKGAARALNDAGAALVDRAAHTGGQMVRSKKVHAEHLAEDVFCVPAADLSAQTVHSIKGEECEAVMVVIHRAQGGDPTAQLELWEKTVAGEDIDAEREEERRVTFVALTRAQRYCLVAVPDTKRGRDIAAACSDLGFVPITGRAESAT